MNDLISQLFEGSDSDIELMEELSRLMDAAAKIEKLSINKTPLLKVLKTLQIENNDLTSTPDGFVLKFSGADDYRLAVKELGTLDGTNKLAEAGWIAQLGGNPSSGSDAPEYYIKFIALDEPDEPSDDVKPADLDKVMKDAANWVPSPDKDA